MQQRDDILRAPVEPFREHESHIGHDCRCEAFVAGEAGLDIIRTPLDHSHRRVRSGRRSPRGGWHEHRELAENRPGAERREDPSVFDDLDTPFENGCDAVSWIAVFEGYVATPTAEGVSTATTRTVVESSLAILALDFLLTVFMFRGGA